LSLSRLADKLSKEEAASVMGQLLLLISQVVQEEWNLSHDP
jgi:uncharacterized protein (DUF2267 family)